MSVICANSITNTVSGRLRPQVAFAFFRRAALGVAMMCAIAAAQTTPDLKALLAAEKAKLAATGGGAAAGAPPAPGAPAAPAPTPGLTAPASVTAGATSEFGCDTLMPSTCYRVMQISSDKDCDLIQPEAVFVTRQGTALKLAVKLLLPAELSVRGGTPKPVPVTLSSETKLPFDQMPISGTVVFRCVLHDEAPPKPLKKGTAKPKPVVATTSFTATLTLVKPASPLQAVIFGPLILAAAAFLYALIMLGIGGHLSKPMGAPEWKLAESFLSNVTVGSGLLNGLMALAFFSVAVLADKDTYMLLSALFAALAALAPFFNSFTRSPNPKFDPKNPDNAPQFIGVVWSFLTASFFTIWGNAAQIALFWCILGEFWIAGKLPLSLLYVFSVVNLLALLLLLVFGAKAMLRIGQFHAAIADDPKEAIATAGVSRSALL